MELSSDDKEVAETLLNLTNIPVTDEVIEAASTLINMKILNDSYKLFQLPISGELQTELKEDLKTIDKDIIDENIEYLIASGILPSTDEITYIGIPNQEGGADKRKRDDSYQTPAPKRERPDVPLSPRQSTRPKTPSKKQQEVLQQQQEEEKDKTLKEAKLLLNFTDAITREVNQQELEKLQEKHLEQLQSYDELPDLLKNIDICGPRSAGVIMNSIFPREVVTKWAKQTKKNVCRRIYELTKPDTQCNMVIDTFEKSKTCYLCGLELDSKIPGWEPTCEHVLPIIQAVFFLELYIPNQPVTDAQRLEYKWAHRCCNSIKHDYSFIKTVLGSDNYPTYEFNKQQVSRTLSIIIGNKSGKFKGIETIQSRVKDITVWKNERIDQIKDNVMTPIIDHIAKKGDKGMAFLIGYRNCLANKNINNKFLELLRKHVTNTTPIGGRHKTFRRKHNGISGVKRRSSKSTTSTHRKV